MKAQFGPKSIDEPNLLYKLQRTLKVFQTSDPMPNRGYSLVASSSKYALVFVGVPSGSLSVYQLSQLVDNECEPQHFSVKLKENPTHIAVNCDQELLLVTGGQLLSFFKVTDFQNQNVSPFLTIKTEVNPSTFVSSLQWNPCVPESIAIAFYQGTLLVCHVNTGLVKKVLSLARCVCWSPKGKRLATADGEGMFFQYRRDCVWYKLRTAPNLFEGARTEALAIYWISKYQFAIVYKNATDNSRPAVTIINTPKAGQTSCINYEDICYSMGSNRPSYYYLQGLATWNIILAGSSNSMELATLGSTDGTNWVQWNQPDDARPALPLTDKNQESYPVGMCIDTCGIHQLPWGENEMLPHMPLLHIVSQSGLLTTFYIINLNKHAPPVCVPPNALVLPANAMTTEVPDDTIAKPAQVAVPAMPTPLPKRQRRRRRRVRNPKKRVDATDILTGVEQIQPQQPILQKSVAPSIPPSSQFSAIQNAMPTKPPQTNNIFMPAPVQIPEQKEIKPVPQSQLQVTVAAPNPTAPEQYAAQIQKNAALKAEQVRLIKLKANQELKNMLVKEVNDFQMELYKFMVRTRETQARLKRDIGAINSNLQLNSLDSEQLKKDCSLDDLKADIVQLKRELVRDCAVVVKPMTHAEIGWRGGHGFAEKMPSRFQKVPMVVSAALICAVPLSCGAASLAAGAAFYAFMLSKMYKEYLGDYVYKLMAKIAARICRVFRRNKNIEESEQSLVLRRQSLGKPKPLDIRPQTENLANSGIDKEKQSEDRDTKELNDPAGNDAKDKEEANKSNCMEDAGGINKEDDVDEDLNNLNFHMMMFFLWLAVTLVNVPALLTWARNFKYSMVLKPDTSYDTGLVMSICSSCIWQMGGPRRNLRYYEAVSYLLFTMAVFMIALGPLSLTIVNYGVTLMFSVITMQQLFDKEDKPSDSNENTQNTSKSETMSNDNESNKTKNNDRYNENKNYNGSNDTRNNDKSETNDYNDIKTEVRNEQCNPCNESRIYNVLTG